MAFARTRSLLWTFTLCSPLSCRPTPSDAVENTGRADDESSTNASNDGTQEGSSGKSGIPGLDDQGDGDMDDDAENDHTTETADDEGPDLKFDLAALPDADGHPTGCAKIDFLFIIDNSSSMEDEQTNLIRSFPGFMQGIRNEVEAQDYQIMVVDTDGIVATQSSTCTSSECTCSFDPYCCVKICNQDPGIETCNGKTCAQQLDVHGCEGEFASGHRQAKDGGECGIEGDHRFLLGDQSNIEDTFACLAERGIKGSDKEQPMAAMLAAIEPNKVAADGCNAGFLRRDAILVVTVITDEEDDPPNDGSPGDPADWYDALVTAKAGNPGAVVTIGFIGDRDTATPICPQLSGTMGAEPSPRLREFLGMAGNLGIAASVCAEDFAPTFSEAIAKIDLACDDFIPPE